MTVSQHGRMSSRPGRYGSSATTTTTLVCDIGACSIKVGIAGKLVPDVIIPSLAGTPRTLYHNNSWNKKKVTSSSVSSSTNEEQHERPQPPQLLLGKDAIQAGKRQTMHYVYVFEQGDATTGRIKNWTLLGQLLQKAFEELLIGKESQGNHHNNNIHYSQYKILVTRPYHMKNIDDTTALVDLFLLKFGFGAVTMHEQAALVLYTQGIETGVVVELGESMTNITPVYKGHAIPKLDRALVVGGASLTAHLVKLLRLKGYQLSKQEDLETGRQIKEQLCFVALDVEADERLASDTTTLVESFRLPDGAAVLVGRERFIAPEALFQPSLWNSEQSGLANAIFEVIQEADIDLRADLYCNIILSGGTSLLPGLHPRLEQDLNHRYNHDILKDDPTRSMGWKPQVYAPESRHHLVFEGAALFADLIAEDPSFWITTGEYKQGGCQLVLDKCMV